MSSGRGGRGRTGRPTVHTVARVAGVGVGTVSRVLNNHPSVRGETRERVLAVMEELNYRPTAQGRRLPVSSADHPLIGIVTADMYAMYGSRVLRGVRGALEQRGFGVVAFSLETPQQHQVLRSGHLHHLLQGLLLCSESAVSDWDASSREGGPPAVRLGALSPTEPSSGIDRVTVDDRYGGLIAGEYAATLPGEIVGVWLDGASASAGHFAARKGLTEGVESAGRQIAQHIEVAPGDHLARVAREVLDRLPKQVTVVAHSDELALALLTEAQARDLAVGREFKVIGYGDHPFAALVGLTTVHQPLEDMAGRAAQLLLDRIAERKQGRTPAEPKLQLLTPRLALRGSA